MLKLKLHWQILIALILAGIAGWAAGPDGSLFGMTFLSVFKFVGTLFINALKMLIVPLIASSIIVGVSGVGSGGNLGRLGGRTLLFYFVTTTLAIIMGLALINFVKPGLYDGEPAGEVLSLEQDTSEFEGNFDGQGLGSLVQIFYRIIPENIVQAAANGQILGLIFFCLLFGFFMSRVESKDDKPLTRFWNSFFQVMMKITGLIMKFAPIGVFGLVATVVAETGFDGAVPLLMFTFTVLAALLLHAVLTLPGLLRYVGGVSPVAMYKAMAPAMLTAFSTASSSATLPVTMDCVEKNAGVSNKISSFVLPLGATVNMNGTALYECMAVIFIAQAYGYELSIGLQIIVVVTALLTSIGVAGIPSASLVAIGIILAAVGLPVEAIGVLFVFDRILDMARTSLNIFGDACCAVIVARHEGEQTLIAVDGSPLPKVTNEEL